MFIRFWPSLTGNNLQVNALTWSIQKINNLEEIRVAVFSFGKTIEKQSDFENSMIFDILGIISAQVKHVNKFSQSIKIGLENNISSVWT